MTIRGAARRWLITNAILVLVACVLGGGHRARAHDPFQIITDVLLRADRLDLRIAMPVITAQMLCLSAAGGASPDDKSPAIEERQNESLVTLRSRIEACGPALYEVTSGGMPLQPREVHVTIGPQSNLEIALIYPRPTMNPLRFEAVHLKRLPDSMSPVFGDALTVTGSGRLLGQALLSARESTLAISLPGVNDEGRVAAGAPPNPRPPRPTFRQYLRLGIEHILTGYDHLLFLGGLLVACRRFRTILTIISCFTLAHSLTLALAALNIVALASRVVEPLIAASIVFVGVENLWRGEEPKGRWALTFTFGLLHGFGFAGALKEIGLGAPGTSIVVPLFAFNLGVELGQVAVASVFLPVLWKLRTVPWFARHGTRAVSLVVAILGSYWLLQRVAL